MTGTNLATISVEDQALLDSSGLDIGDGEKKGSYFPQLKINKQGEDDAGNSLITGSLYIDGHDTYGLAQSKVKEIRFRPVALKYQYIGYDRAAQPKWELLSKSINVDSQWDEALDNTGGVRCGRPSNDVFFSDQLTPEQKKDINTFTPNKARLFGIAYFDDKEGVLVELNVGGGKISDIFKGLKLGTQDGAKVYNRIYTIKTKRAVNGNNVWYDLDIKPDMTTSLDATSILPALKEVSGYINSENEEIMRERRAYMSKDSQGQEAEAVMKTVEEVDVGEDTFEDKELPF